MPMALVFVIAIGPVLLCLTARSAKWRSPAPKYTPTYSRTFWRR